jgi:hypothetical protein
MRDNIRQLCLAPETCVQVLENQMIKYKLLYLLNKK